MRMARDFPGIQGLNLVDQDNQESIFFYNLSESTKVTYIRTFLISLLVDCHTSLENRKLPDDEIITVRTINYTMSAETYTSGSQPVGRRLAACLNLCQLGRRKLSSYGESLTTKLKDTKGDPRCTKF